MGQPVAVQARRVFPRAPSPDAPVPTCTGADAVHAHMSTYMPGPICGLPGAAMHVHEYLPHNMFLVRATVAPYHMGIDI